MCLAVSRLQSTCKDVISLSLSQIDKSPEGQFTQLMTLPRTLQQQINHIMDPPGRNRDVEETLLQVAQDPDCGDVVRLGVSTSDVEQGLAVGESSLCVIQTQSFFLLA